jgi:hypothetical protein
MVAQPATLYFSSWIQSLLLEKPSRGLHAFLFEGSARLAGHLHLLFQIPHAASLSR